MPYPSLAALSHFFFFLSHWELTAGNKRFMQSFSRPASKKAFTIKSAMCGKMLNFAATNQIVR